MTCIYTTAERELAELRGWTNIKDVGGTLIGCPPDGSGVRGQAAVWRYARDNDAAFQLQAESRCSIEWWLSGVTARIGATAKFHALFANHPSEIAALRFAIMQAKIAQLKAKERE